MPKAGIVMRRHASPAVSHTRTFRCALPALGLRISSPGCSAWPFSGLKSPEPLKGRHRISNHEAAFGCGANPRLFPVPARRKLKLIGTEFHPAFYTPQVQNLLKALHKNFPDTAAVIVAEDRVALLAWPIILFEIVSRIAVQFHEAQSVTKEDRAQFWLAYEEDPFTTALLFQRVTEYNLQWPGVWQKQRLLGTALAAPQFSGTQPEWKVLIPWIDSLREEVDNPRDVQPKNCSQELLKINKRRKAILLDWKDCIKAREQMRESGPEVPPLILRIPE
jgi:hypothetical protein